MNTIKEISLIQNESLSKANIWLRINLTTAMALLIIGVVVSITNPLMGIRAITFGLYEIYVYSKKMKK